MGRHGRVLVKSCQNQLLTGPIITNIMQLSKERMIHQPRIRKVDRDTFSRQRGQKEAPFKADIVSEDRPHRELQELIHRRYAAESEPTN